MSATYLHENDALRDMANVHITFEVTRLLVPHHESFPPAIGWHSDLIRYIGESLLESLLIHMRNVVHFLMDDLPTSKGRKTDVVALHYFVNHEHSWTRPNALLASDRTEHIRLMKCLDRYLAHVSTDRLNNFDWSEVRSRVPDVARSFRGFVDALPPERRDWFGPVDTLLRHYGY